MKRIFISASLAVFTLASVASAAEAKKLLVVSATVGARHASIPNGEKMLRDLAAKSNGQFSLVLMSDDTDYPFSRVPGGGGRGAPPGFPGAVTGARMAQLDALFTVGAAIPPLVTAATAAQTQLTSAPFTQPDTISAKVDTVAAAELNLALARSAALEKVQSSSNKLSPDQVLALAGRAPPPAGRGGSPAIDNSPVIAALFQKFLSADALKNYDGIILLDTTGLLPFPDRDAFLKWVSDGHAVVGIHAAMDTSYNTSDSYIDVLSGGARYATSIGGSATARKIYKVDAAHPATKDWPDGLAVIDEFFQFSRKNPADSNTNLPGLDRSKVHSLLDMDFDGQRLPVAWTKMQGKGRVFYTSLGHRNDVLVPGRSSLDGAADAEVNADNVSVAYQTHVLNGIRWALGLVDGNNSTGNAK